MNAASQLDQILRGVRRSGASLDALPELQGPVGIWGAGTVGRKIRAALRDRGVETAFFIDNDEMLQGEHVDGVEVLPTYLASRHAPVPVLVSISPGYYQAMMLRRMGFEEYYLIGEFTWPAAQIMDNADKIMAVYNMLQDHESRETYAATLRMWQSGSMEWGRVAAYPQYKHPVVKVAQGDVVINSGGFNGNTASNFVRTAGGQCRIISFEPCAQVYVELVRNIEQRKENGFVEPVNMALWQERAQLQFNAPTPMKGNSSVNENGNEIVEACDLDSWITTHGGHVDLIELDVEGSEPSVIMGATKTIQRCMPKLMISLYHRPWHLWELPLQINNLVPEYTFYLGHHSHGYGETVLYASVTKQSTAFTRQCNPHMRSAS